MLANWSEYETTGPCKGRGPNCGPWINEEKKSIHIAEKELIKDAILNDNAITIATKKIKKDSLNIKKVTYKT